MSRYDDNGRLLDALGLPTLETSPPAMLAPFRVDGQRVFNADGVLTFNLGEVAQAAVWQSIPNKLRTTTGRLERNDDGTWRKL